MRRILIVAGRYLPGYKDGGPIRSIKNLTDYLGDEYEFHILTSDRDIGDTKPYLGIRVNDWNTVGKASVYYVAPNRFTLKTILRLAEDADLVYSCGIFTRRSFNVFLLNRLRLINKPVVVASMGMFSPLEFRLKYWKKKPYVMMLSALGMFKNIYWSATSEMEVREICREVKAKPEQFYISEDLPRMVDPTQIVKEKKVGELSVCWISRIAPKKNLMKAIEILSCVKSKIDFTIYGPSEDAEYWGRCQRALKQLPDNISWQYKGNVDPEQVVQTLKKHQIFLFPTLGENYGHVIQEALSAGCPCILSDQTPWQDLEENGVGYVFSLDETERFADAVESYAEMGQEEFQKVSDRALQYAVINSNEKVVNTGYRKIFELKLGRGG